MSIRTTKMVTIIATPMLNLSMNVMNDLPLQKDNLINENLEKIRKKTSMTGDNNVTKTALPAAAAIRHMAADAVDNEAKEAKADPNTEAAQSYQHPPSTATSTRTPSVSDTIVRDL